MVSPCVHVYISKHLHISAILLFRKRCDVCSLSLSWASYQIQFESHGAHAKLPWQWIYSNVSWCRLWRVWEQFNRLWWGCPSWGEKYRRCWFCKRWRRRFWFWRGRYWRCICWCQRLLEGWCRDSQGILSSQSNRSAFQLGPGPRRFVRISAWFRWMPTYLGCWCSTFELRDLDNSATTTHRSCQLGQQWKLWQRALHFASQSSQGSTKSCFGICWFLRQTSVGKSVGCVAITSSSGSGLCGANFLCSQGWCTRCSCAPSRGLKEIGLWGPICICFGTCNCAGACIWCNIGPLCSRDCCFVLEWHRPSCSCPLPYQLCEWSVFSLRLGSRRRWHSLWWKAFGDRVVPSKGWLLHWYWAYPHGGRTETGSKRLPKKPSSRDHRARARCFWEEASTKAWKLEIRKTCGQRSRRCAWEAGQDKCSGDWAHIWTWNCACFSNYTSHTRDTCAKLFESDVWTTIWAVWFQSSSWSRADPFAEAACSLSFRGRYWARILGHTTWPISWKSRACRAWICWLDSSNSMRWKWSEAQMVQVTDSSLGPYQGKALDRVLQYAAILS